MKCLWAPSGAKRPGVRGLLVGLLAAVTLTAADSSYIIGADRGTPIAALAAKYQFTVVKSSDTASETYYAVKTAAPLSASDVSSLNSETGVRDVEVNSTVVSTESDPSSTAGTDLQSLGNLLSTRKTVAFYGNSVLASYVHQPGTRMIELRGALSGFGTGGGVVAVIDTGVDPDHPALAGALAPGYDFTRDRPDTVSELLDLPAPVAIALQQSTVELLDSKQVVVGLQQSTVELLDQSTVELLDGAGLPAAFGHGTMVSGLIHLAAPGATIMPLKAFHADGTACLFDIASAIRFAVDNGATVISMSFAYTTPSPILEAAIAYAIGHGVVCIASAGNGGADAEMYPAGYRGVIGVGSVNSSDKRSPFSNYGRAARTSAPGEALVTIFPGGNYAAVWGTSFSSALVAGGTALMRSVHADFDFSDLRQALDAGVQIDQGMGRARLDLLRSLNFLLTEN